LYNEGPTVNRAMVWLIAAACSVAPAAAAAADRATQARTIAVGGLTRSYLLHVPPALPAGPVPLVLALHGGGGHGVGSERLTRFSELADREGVLGAYPEGVGRNRYDGREFTGGSRARRERIDDVGFVAAMLDAIARSRAVDPRRSTPPASPTARSSPTTSPRISPRASRSSRRWSAGSPIRPTPGCDPSGPAAASTSRKGSSAACAATSAPPRSSGSSSAPIRSRSAVCSRESTS